MHLFYVLNRRKIDDIIIFFEISWRFFCINNPSFFWFSSYLVNKTQQVKRTFFSDILPIISGIPQEDHLSHLLFAIFIMNLSNYFECCDYLLIVDDLKCMLMFLQLITRSIQVDLNWVSDWYLSNGLKLNKAKCLKMSFYRSNTKLNNNYHHKGEFEGGTMGHSSLHGSYFFWI
jgi:hypothetical protein